MAKQLTKYIGNTPTSNALIDGMLYNRVYATTAQDNEFTFSLRDSWLGIVGNKLHSTIAWSDYQQAAIYKALESFTDVLDISFREVSNPDLADFDIGIANSSQDASINWNGVAGYAYAPSSYTGQYNDIRFNNSTTTQASTEEGQKAFSTMIHEMGHALGLRHPHEATNDEFGLWGYSWAAGKHGLNDDRYTVMSYREVAQVHSASLMALDIAALQSQYGMAEKNTSGTTYNLEDVVGKSYKCIWDTGGTDTLKYSGTANVVIDLRSAHLNRDASAITGEGKVSALGYNGAAGYFSGFYDGNQYDDSGSELKGGYYIANGVVIENATGGSGNDRLIGNSATNILTGNDGNDTLVVQDDGNDVLKGGSGDDCYIISISPTHVGDIILDNYATTNGYDELTLNYSAAQLLAIDVLRVNNNLICYFDANSSLNFQNWFLGGLYQLDKITLTDGSYTGEQFQKIFWDAPKDDDYTFSKGDGNLVITDSGGEDSLTFADLMIQSADFVRNGNDLVIIDLFTKEKITITDHYGKGKIEKFYFSNATTNAAEIEYILKGAILGGDSYDSYSNLFRSTSGSDIMIGFKGGDTIYLEDNSDTTVTDTIVFSQGFGREYINFESTYKEFTGQLKLVFTDMRSTDFSFTMDNRDKSEYLVIQSLLSPSDHINISKFTKNLLNQLTIEFSDTTFNYSDLANKIEGPGIYIGTEEDNIITPTAQQDDFVYVLKGGNDRLIIDDLFSGIHGGAGDDHITLTSNASASKWARIKGDGGNDIIDLRGVMLKDINIQGGQGDDTIYVCSELGVVEGGDGNDNIYIEGKKGIVKAGAGIDKIYSGGSDDRITMDGLDTLYYSLGDGNDLIACYNDEKQSSLVFTDLSSSDISIFNIPTPAGFMKQVFFIKETGESIYMSQQSCSNYIFTDGTYQTQKDGSLTLGVTFDKYLQIQNSNMVQGTSAHDYILDSAQGYRTVYGREGDDLIIENNSSPKYIYAGEGNDTVLGDYGAEKIYGESGDDIVSALRGDDQLYGGAGNDVLNGGLDNDILTGGTGDDRLYGGFDNDEFIYSLYDGNDVIGDKHGFDTLSLTDISFSDVAMTQQSDDMVLHILSSGENITILGQFDAPNMYEKEGETTIDRFDFMDGSFTADEIMDLFMGPPPPPMFA